MTVHCKKTDLSLLRQDPFTLRTSPNPFPFVVVIFLALDPAVETDGEKDVIEVVENLQKKAFVQKDIAGIAFIDPFEHMAPSAFTGRDCCLDLPAEETVPEPVPDLLEWLLVDVPQCCFAETAGGYSPIHLDVGFLPGSLAALGETVLFGEQSAGLQDLLPKAGGRFWGSYGVARREHQGNIQLFGNLLGFLNEPVGSLRLVSKRLLVKLDVVVVVVLNPEQVETESLRQSNHFGQFREYSGLIATKVMSNQLLPPRIARNRFNA